jgi:UrcA family protein
MFTSVDYLPKEILLMTLRTAKTANRRVFRSALLVVLAAALGAHVTGSRAADDDEPKSMTVSYADLNLSTPAGVAALRRRIHWAATVVCGGDPPSDLEGQVHFRLCVADAADKALQKVQVALAQVQPEVK